MNIISISLPKELTSQLDEVAKKYGYASRSELFRQALRNFIADHHEYEDVRGQVIATITILYDRRQRGELLEVQHEYGDVINSLMHVHVDEKSCLEVLVISGESEKVKELIAGLKTTRGVKQLRTAFMHLG
ncbi:MAG: nickel-responsive transcriptional regulator NikR [Candidatus Verstraetearchaeota archaeon]|nr:nickel-responsive transcriptional regulator NikR [Candidatus Verstraetearchaeota archaeon]